MICPAAATEDEAAGVATSLIPLEEWDSMVRGRTVTYRIGQEVWAQEVYAPHGNAVWIQLSDGTCMSGTWYHVRDTYCFDWDPALSSCFRHVRRDGEILIIPVVDGEPAGDIQTVAAINDLPLTCSQTYSS